MALEKTDISIDLVSGADTKVNTQIDTSFQEMINVSFDGDMTAKKMKGYDLLDTLPAGEKYSLIARRQQDLIVQTDKGVHKYLPSFQKFKKITDMGSCVVESNEYTGFTFDFSPDFKASVSYTTEEETVFFYTKEGVLLNKVSQVPDSPDISRRLAKIIHKGNDFYVCGGIRGSVSSNYVVIIRKFSFDALTFSFVETQLLSVNIGSNPFISLDFFCDGTRVFVFYSSSSVKNYSSYDLNLGLGITVAMGNTPNGQVEIYQADDPLYLWVMMSTAGGVANTSLLKLIKLSKPVLTEDLVTDISTKAGTGQVGSITLPIYTALPISDTVAVFLWSTVFKIQGLSGVLQNLPTGKIFISNGTYYVPILMNSGNNICSVVLKLNYNSSTSEWYVRYPMGITDSGQITPSFTVPTDFFVKNNTLEEDGSFYFPSVTPARKPTKVSFNSDAKQTNSYIEIGRRVITSGGLLGYFDGINYAEYSFIGNPYPFTYVVGTGGTLPADSGYQFVSIYKYEDVDGNLFYSQPSPVYSGGDPVNGLTLLANAKVTVNIQQAILTEKERYTVEVYIKRKNKPFQLCYQKEEATDYNIDIQNNGTRGFQLEITSYPPAEAKIYPYQDGSVPPETTSNSISISLYADRIFRFSKDNPISLAYSQKKIPGYGFEFNDSFLYLDALDKRGVEEDDLTGSLAMDGRLIIFKQSSVLYINGSGPSRANTQDDFSDPQLVASGVGCTEPRSIILTPNGIMFKSNKGIYLLDRSLQVGYIGSNVEKFNNYKITSAVLNEKSNEVRFSTLEGVVLVYNYLSSAWSWFINIEGVSACIFNEKYAILNTDGQVLLETPSHNKLIDQEIIQTISSPWLRLNKIQGYQKAYYVRILGNYKTLHRLKMNVFYDYELYPSEEYLIDPLAANQYNIEIKPTNEAMENGTATNGVYQMKIDLVRKNCQAVRVVIQDVPLDVSLNTGECFALSNITVNIGLKKGLAKIQASKSY